MSVAEELRRRLLGLVGDAELRRLSPGLALAVSFAVGSDAVALVFADGHVTVDTVVEGDVSIVADEKAWRQVLSSPPPPRFHSFTAWQIANPDFQVGGEPLRIAQARAALERIVELLVGETASRPSPYLRDMAQLSGRYHPMLVGETSFQVYCDHAGQGVPVLLLHTAGADSRQFLAQTSDVELARDYRMYGLDLPFHGRSLPPDDWTGEPYRLTAEIYKSWCAAFIEQVIGEPALVVGCSMGAAMALVMAADRPDLVRGAVALEPPFRSPGRRNPYQNHVAVHGGLHNGAFVRGLMSPTSPIACRRRASWIYSQGGPGVYPGDLAFYSDEFDGAEVAPRIDAARTPVALLSGVYDYSATPADGARLAELIPGALHVVMDGIGHFPMTENPDHFRRYLLQGLEHARSRAA
ncbi:MAG: alpha/beta hydrolase [Rhizobiaceae bacterium]|nr:alpha/beta hydrolase [Rhizobiaceae bacterium]